MTAFLETVLFFAQVKISFLSVSVFSNKHVTANFHMAPFIVTQQVSLLSVCSLRCPLRIDELNKTLRHASSQTLEIAANLSVRTLMCMMSSIREMMPFPHTHKKRYFSLFSETQEYEYN